MKPGYRVRLDRCDAYTLIEVLIAVAVLSFSVAAITQAIVAGQMQTYEALKQTRGLALMEQLEGQVLSTDYDEVVTFDGYCDGQGSDEQIVNDEGEYFPAAFQSYTRSVDVLATSVQTNFAGEQSGLMVRLTVKEGSGGRTWEVVRFIPEPAL